MHLFGFQAKIKQTCSLPFVFSPVHVASPLGCSTEWSLLFCVLPQHWWLLTIIAGLTWLFSHLYFPLTPWKLTPALLHIAEQALRRKCVVKGGTERAPACRGKARESKTGAHVPFFFFFSPFFSSFVLFPSFFSPHLLKCEESCCFIQAASAKQSYAKNSGSLWVIT